jgi:ribonuclease P/MRP protein subunit POP1
MIEDNTPTVTARRRKPTQIMRIRLESARRLQNLNARTKNKRLAAKIAQAKDTNIQLKGGGSHNFDTAPRIPKIKKNKLSRPPPADAKFRKRQQCKTWLPTHLFHAKRAQVTTTKNPLWRFAIPLSPTEKSYRPTHRTRGARGAMAWDMSYMSTIQLEGSESSIEAVLLAVGISSAEGSGLKGKKWKAGARSLEAWAFEMDHPTRPTAPVTMIWCAVPKSEDVEMANADDSSSVPKITRRKLWVRVHPSAFLQLWNDLLDASKRQSPPVMVEDLRFEIGSIEITGPGSTEALIAALRPSNKADGQLPAPQSPEAIWPALLGVSNPSSLPQNALLSFNVSDPRLEFPPRKLDIPDSESHMNDLTVLLSKWSPDQTQGPSSLFDRPSRLAATRQLPSQKAINRRRNLSGPGNYPAPEPTDPQIPAIILANRSRTHLKRNSAPGSWTVLLPWKCVPPVWYSLMYYPLSSGGNPRFGGVKQQQQLAFEAGEAWFPGDFPGTRAGWEWNQREAEKSRHEWERRPKGRRVEYDSLVLGDGHPKGEIGRGWTCDWERLVQGTSQDVPENTTSTSKKADGAKPDVPDTSIPPSDLHNLRFSTKDTNKILSNLTKSQTESAALSTVYVSLIHRGTPTPCSRVYRLPTNPTLRAKWLQLASANQKSAGGKAGSRKPSDFSDDAARRQLTQSLIAAVPEDSPSIHLEVPAADDLIGFVTTGNYNLSEGKGTGIASILLSKVAESNVKLSEKKLCIVRSAGEKVGRLATWEIV